MTDLANLSLRIDDLLRYYADEGGDPAAVVEEVYHRIEAWPDSGVWVSLVPKDQVLGQARALAAQKFASGAATDALPLFGIPFCVKDNIHVKGLPTTASCPAFSHFPEITATVVERLTKAGALLIGKNTMDQFATGLVGIRSPVHPVNPFNPDYIPGGSSSGSAVAVSKSLVSFALGSDTGGSGRIPAALNNIVGLKPTPGRVSTYGMVYANQSFDCVPVFALTCSDAMKVWECIQGYDPLDPFSRKTQHPPELTEYKTESLRIAIPASKDRQFFSDKLAEDSFNEAIERVKQAGNKVLDVDFSLFREAGKMIFNGPLLAERLASIGEFLTTHQHDIDPVVGAIVDKASAWSAVDLCKEYYRLKAIKRQVTQLFEQFDVLMVPTAPTIYTIDAVKANPVELNSHMGYYTYFANLLGLSALAVPAAIRDDGLPFGICFLAPADGEQLLIDQGQKWEQLTRLNPGYQPAPASPC